MTGEQQWRIAIGSQGLISRQLAQDGELTSRCGKISDRIEQRKSVKGLRREHYLNEKSKIQGIYGDGISITVMAAEFSLIWQTGPNA